MDATKNVIIESLGTYLPPESQTTSEVMKACANKIHFPVENITGIKTRRIAGKNEFSIDLATKAISDCLAHSRYTPKDIDLLVCCNISRYDDLNRLSFEPCTSIKLRKHFEFNNAVVFDLTNACAGMFTGIFVVKTLIESGAIQRGMVVSGEYITHLTQTAQKEIESYMDTRLACLTLGDAGAALILEASDNQCGFQALELQTLSSYSQYCTAKASEYGGMIMYTDSVNLTDAAVKSGATSSLNVLQNTGWSPDSFQHLIMHQTSRMTLNSARREINQLFKKNICNDTNTINNLENRGNTASTSHFVALRDQIIENKIQSGDKVIFSISASGLTIGTALYKLDDLPNRLQQIDGSTIKFDEIRVVKRRSESNSSLPKVRIESIGTSDLQRNGQNGDSMELLKQAAINCLNNSSYQFSDIDLVLYAGVYRSEYLLEPAYATLLAGELDINSTLSETDDKKTFAFDIFNGAVGFLNACFFAQQMIMTGNCQAALILASENENNRENFPDELMHIKETGSALILDRSPNNKKGFSPFKFNYYTEVIDAYTAVCNLENTNPFLEIIKDPKLEDIYVDCINTAVQDFLEEQKMNLNQFNIIFPPQISSAFITRLSESLRQPRNKLVEVAMDGKDLFTSSMVYSFHDAYKNNIVKAGDKGLIIAAGSGIQVGCTIYHF